MKSFLSRPTSRRVHINWDTLRLCDFPSHHRSNLRIVFPRGYFRTNAELQGREAKGPRAAGFSLSSVIAAGALDKQDFPSLTRWARINARWVKLIESSPGPARWQRWFLTGNLHWDCCARTATKRSTAAAETCRVQGGCTPLLPSPELSTAHPAVSSTSAAQETQHLPDKFTLSLTGNKNTQNRIIKLKNNLNFPSC